VLVLVASYSEIHDEIPERGQDAARFA
jgi:hypothetical protein